MNQGVEAFRAKLASLGAKNIGIYVGVYFMEEHSISVDNYSAIWIPSYGPTQVTMRVLQKQILAMTFTNTLHMEILVDLNITSI